MLSGDLDNPILDADTLVAEDGRISAIGKAADVDSERATTVVDAKGTTVAPGLIDSHVHPVFGDWTPRQNTLNWIDSCMHGGVTTMVSAGEVHLPGRPKDIVGLKALAITAQRAFSAFPPGGPKVHAGAARVRHQSQPGRRPPPVDGRRDVHAGPRSAHRAPAESRNTTSPVMSTNSCPHTPSCPPSASSRRPNRNCSPGSTASVGGRNTRRPDRWGA